MLPLTIVIAAEQVILFPQLASAGGVLVYGEVEERAVVSEGNT